jgi:hypothetical protein
VGAASRREGEGKGRGGGGKVGKEGKEGKGRRKWMGGRGEERLRKEGKEREDADFPLLELLIPPVPRGVE